MRNVNKIFQYALTLYVVLLLYFLYSLRYSIFALLINPFSLVSFIVGIALLVVIVSAPFVGISHLKKPRRFKLVYTVFAMLLVVAGLAVSFIRDG